MHPGNTDITNSNTAGIHGPPGSGMNAFDSDFPALANRVGNSQSSRPGRFSPFFQMIEILIHYFIIKKSFVVFFNSLVKT